ncbi:sulfatase-like hydrolase/transferase [Wenyingzhuangia sp. 2_MG-2023]|uniref:sulfatase-like hydrolase/transferase n=1 Tax=Wenyingzhuangia sp. 2_MG-2023 TaxID=3062639 RepID=UPI0026E478E4|nr:sulfatase-like hydrolase/transferase [Wenyingzhuangia sp. 2_MG-2023]MDO6738219.1 sulfatase-like hydrolase/transferase [Wenyingzhuangia sp. 2_MG-2023]
MKNRIIVLISLVLLSCGNKILKQSTATTKTSISKTMKPNVIFIKTDDQRYNSMGFTGHPITKTPNIDQLATEAVYFKNAFITSPICGPSRANFFTSQWERTNKVGFTHVSKNFVPKKIFDNSYLMQLKKNGYFTGYLGKHHTNIGPIGERNQYMKDNLDFCYMASGHLGFHLTQSHSQEFSNLKNETQIEGLYEATETFLEPTKEKDYFFDNAGSSVKHFLNRRDKSKPFCLSINFNLPHAASIGGMGKKPTDPEMYKSLYQDQLNDFPMPEGYPIKKSSLPDNVFKQEDLMGYYNVTSENFLRDKKMKMARAVTGIDNFVGNLRKQLQEMGVAENTILVFISDHGLLLGEHGLGGKTFLYEESIRVPFLIYSPFLKGGERVIEEMVVGQDVPPTILDMCGLETPNTYQGKSVLPLIQGKTKNWRKDVFFENLFTQQGYPRIEAVRTKEWKYIRYFSKDNDRDQYLPMASVKGEQPIYEELFYLKDDSKEQINLAGEQSNKAILKELRERCNELVTDLATEDFKQ